jgi:membrane protein required for colicin V production
MALVPFDIACLLLILLVAVRASLRGLVEEIAHTASVVLGLLASALFFDEGAAFIRGRGIITLRFIPEAVAFIAVFIMIFAAVRLLESVLKDIIRRISLTSIDHLLGFFFGVAEALVIIIVLILLLSIQPLFDKNILLNGSFFAQLLLPNAEALRRGLSGIHV